VQLRAGAGGLSDKPSGIRAGAAASMTGVDVQGRQHAGKPETTVAAKTTAWGHGSIRCLETADAATTANEGVTLVARCHGAAAAAPGSARSHLHGLTVPSETANDSNASSPILAAIRVVQVKPEMGNSRSRRAGIAAFGEELQVINGC